MIVLDASALVDVVLDRPPRDDVLGLLGDEIIAPAHQPAEALSAIARLVRTGSITTAVGRAALVEVGLLDQELIPPTIAHLEAALALQDRIRVVDGLYVTLARERNCPLVTTDDRLSRSDPPCEVILAA